MTDQTYDLSRTRRATAVLVTCVVQTLRQSDDTFQFRFLDQLSNAFRELRDDPEVDFDLLSLTRDLLVGSGFDESGKTIDGAEASEAGRLNADLEE